MSVPNQATGNEVSIGLVAGIPVRFSPWYLLLVGIIYWRTGNLQVGTIVLFCITISVLFHELGHGLMARHYGQRPSIVIHAFGGWTERVRVADRRKDLRIVAAGPGVSLGLAMLFWLIGEVMPAATPGHLQLAIRYMAGTNLLWAGFNLLPVLPMDGGRMLQLQLGYHVPANRADGITYWVGTIVGALGAVAVWAYMGSLIMALFLGMMAWQSGQNLAWHPFQNTFKLGGHPAARGGSGFELPPLIAILVGLLVGGFFGAWKAVAGGGLGLIAMVPEAVRAGHAVWTPLLSPFVHLEWGPFLYSLVALWWFGPPVYRVLNSNLKFLLLYLGALWTGSLCAVFLAGPLGLGNTFFVGAGAGSTALLVAWARFVPPAPIFAGFPLLPKQLAAIVIVGEAALVLSGWVAWGWPAHVVGVLFGLLIPPQKIADNVVELFPQGEQDVWH